MGVDPISLGILGVGAGAKYLMNRSANKKQAKTIQNTYAPINQRNDALYNDVMGRIGGARERDDVLRNTVMSGYNNILSGATARTPVQYQSRALPGFEEFARTGGWGASDTADVEDNIRRYKQIADTGGADGFYKELMKTGGYAEKDVANIRDRIASQTPALYDSLRGELERKRSAAGGYAPGFEEGLAKLTRERSRGAADAVREGEIGLAESIRGGKERGAAGFSANVLAGLSGANAARMGLVNSRNAGRQFGLTGLEGVSGREYEANRYNADAEYEDRLGALSGLLNLRGQAPAEESMYLDALLSSMGMSSRDRQAMLGATLENQAAGSGNNSELVNDLLTAWLAAKKPKTQIPTLQPSYGRPNYSRITPRF